MASEEKRTERKLLICRVFSKEDAFEVGKELEIPFFDRLVNCWEADNDEASLEIAKKIDDLQLKNIFAKHKGRGWSVFRGKYYTYEDGELKLGGSWEKVQAGIAEANKRYDKDFGYLLKLIAKTGSFGLEEFREASKRNIDPYPILERLEQLKVVVPSYRSEEYREWKVLEETLPLVRAEAGISASKIKAKGVTTIVEKKATPLEDERKKIAEMDSEFDGYLNDLIKHKLRATVNFGREFSAVYLADYLRGLFGDLLYFDGFLSIIQQYGLANVEIVNPQGKTGMKTGWSLALFGEPGTGKSFATRDLILGGLGGQVHPHGIPGRNRYCGGITPARFIRIGQAYAGRVFNFIVPEFNDWFRYSGMVDVLKLAMERGEIKYELHREVVGPYLFDSFFSVNYNTKVSGGGYEVSIGDPNFNAIEDRMICRLHSLTKQRYVEIAQSQKRLALGEISFDEMAQQIRDHATLVYAIERAHPFVRDRFPAKPVMITEKIYETIGKAREAILKRIPKDYLRFSARIEGHLIRFACACSLLNYFSSDLDFIPINKDALKWAIKLYVEEASVRSKEQIQTQEILDMFN